MRLTHIFLLALLSITTLNTRVCAQGLPLKNFSIQSGLSQSVVNDIFQDADGYIWIATEFGLNKFNMFSFINYFEENGLSHNNTHAIFQTSRGEILIGTDNGLDVLEGNGFSRYPGTDILRGSSVIEIFEDNLGGLWIGTNSVGLFYFRDDSFQHYSTENGLVDNTVRSIVQLDDDRIAVATRGGISVLSSRNRQIVQNYTQQDGLSESRTRDILQRQDGSIWVATRNGITILNDGELSYLNVRDGLIHPRVNKLMDDGNGGVWIATEGGISHYEYGRFANYTDNNGLSNNIITSLFKDFEGNVWIGSYGGGADLLGRELFLHYTVQQGLLSNMITSFAQDPAGGIWIGSYGGGISRVQDQTVMTLTTANNLIDNRVYTMTKDRMGRIWIGTRNGVSLMENGRIFPGNQFPDLPDPKVRRILEDRNGDMWIATYGGGIARYRNGVRVRVYDTSNGLPNNIVMDMLETRDGTIWAATHGGVVMIRDNQMTAFNTENGLVQNSTISVFEDSIGQIWIGTFGGLSVYFAGSIRNITTDDGLPNNVVYFVTEDERGFIWIGTNNGLVRYNVALNEDISDPDRVRDDLRFKNYTTEAGLTSIEMNSSAVFREQDGNIWLGTVGGANIFRTRMDVDITAGPPIHIERLRLFEEVQSHDIREFRHDQNFIGFDFVGLSFANPSGILYEYRLRDVDQTWQQTRQRSVRYTTLPPGDYRFEVRARNHDGYWSTRSTSISFIIAPPYWRTWWFYLIMSFAILLILGFIYNYFRISKLVDLERIRIRIASDLHDDVGASLTEIALQADFLQATQKDPATGESLRQMGEMSRRIVTTMDDIVWSIDARNDTYGDLLDRMQDYATNVLIPKDIEPEFHFKGINTDKIMALEYRQNIYLIFKEAINNAAKHSGATRMIVLFEIESGEYLLSIADNGNGLPEKTRSGGHGLKNMQLRATRVGAELSYIDDNGLTIRLTGKGL